MNTVLKEHVYSQGNSKWADYIEILSGMNQTERTVFEGFREVLTDEAIMADLNIDSQKTFGKIEQSVEKKLLWAILYCVDFTMRNDK